MATTVISDKTHRKVSDTHWLVRSRSNPDVWYHVRKDKKGWHCNCPAGTFNKCTHIKRNKPPQTL